MATYNISNISTEMDLISLVTGVNTQTEGLFSLLLLISIFVIIFISTKNFEVRRSFASASFVTLVISVLLLTMGMIQLYLVVVLIVMTGGSAVLLFTEQG